MSHLPGLLVLLAFAGAVLVAALTAILVWQARHPPRRTAGYAVARGLACDPEEAGFAADAWVLDRPGAHLPVWEIDGRAATGLTAVFVHGWGQSRLDMLAGLGPWPDLAARLVLYDLRGHGEATGGPSRLGSGEAADLRALLGRLGAGPFILVGHSMGAGIAIEAAAGATDVVGVVAYGAYADLHASLCGRLRERALPARPLADLAMAWLRLRGLRPTPGPALAAALPCPLLLVQGADDVVAPPAGARAIAAAAPDAEMEVVPGASHLDARTVDTAGHDATVRRFVARLGRPPPDRS